MASHLNAPIAALAASQHGLVTRAQVLGLGLTVRQIDRRLASETWEHLAPSVYGIAGTPTQWKRLVHAATLSIAESAASQLTAAGLHVVLAHPPPRPHVTVAFGRSVRSPAAVVHRARLTPLDITTVDGIPCTTLERTLVDCAAIVGPRRLQSLVDSALHTGQVTPRSIDVAWERSQRAPGRHGHAALLAALVEWREPIRPGSPAEMRLIRQLGQWGFPPPERQIEICDATGTVIAMVDVGWRAWKLGIEYDSERWHDPTRWAADETRHRAIEQLGWTLLRADKTDLRPGATAFRDELTTARALLAAA